MLSAPRSPYPDVVCLSHLRWHFVFQRPQHLLTRCARDHRVFFVEEAVIDPSLTAPRLQVDRSGAVTVVVPHVPKGLTDTQRELTQHDLLDGFLEREQVVDFVLWYYTPMALGFSRHLSPRAIIYDCMDELSAFKGASAQLKELESELMRRADVVLTGGHSLYEAKRDQHSNIHPFPSSVDVAHFAQARIARCDPADQALLARPRLGYFGVIDERMDLELLEGIASARPDWQIIMLGPIVKIDPALVPRADNIHYLGAKRYEELPQYVGGWDVALMPFARNEATRFISPTKTPEYMAAGKPVVSTSIQDVVRPYGQQGLVRIADDVHSFVEACSQAMREDTAQRLAHADSFLRHMSWDRTWTRIHALVNQALRARTGEFRAGAGEPPITVTQGATASSAL
jgi:UDP-galactopyranose mutase